MRPAVSLFTFLVASCTTLFTLGQSPSHRMTPDERAGMPDYLRLARNAAVSGVTTPPTTAVRASAEWEEIDALIVVWTSYTTIVRQIIQAARTETRVIVVCNDSTVVKNNLIANAVPLSNISYLVTGYNSIWCRDYGPWNVYTNEIDSLYLIDWIYNRPRPKDDTLPASIARYEHLPLYQTTTAPYDLVHTGGNFMCDGMGTGFSSKLILTENPSKTEPQIDSIMHAFMGINRYIKMNTLPYDQIHHIDMHMKLLDEETLLVGEYPSGIADGPSIEANLNHITGNFTSAFGTPYKVIRIPMPPDASGNYPNTGGDYRTYANAVFVNRSILVPFYDQQYDTTAARIWHEAMPGYRIVGIDCNQIIPSLGAIHCITKEISSNDLLRIVHQPLPDQLASTPAYTVTATFQHRSGIATATVYYRTDTLLPYTAVTMTPTGVADSYAAAIPGQPSGSTVYYYLGGSSNSGKSSTRPLTAPSGYWKFNVDGTTPSSALAQAISIGALYPNPSHGLTCLQVFVPSTQSVKVRLLTLTGSIMKTAYEGVAAPGEKRVWFDTSGLAAGIYLVETECEGAVYRQKLAVR